MTIDMSKAMSYSWMSQASYLDLGLVGTGNLSSFISALTESAYNAEKRFVEKQAAIFTDATTGYSFVSQSPGTNGNDDYGFSATVFKSNIDNTYTVAVRGTEPGAQALVDLWRADGLGVVLAGKAIEQLISAYRYYKELISPTTAGIYTEAEITELCQLYAKTPAAILAGPAIEGEIALFEDSLRHDVGLGKIPAGATINFSGHSLGGHVATLLATMVAVNDTTHSVGDVYTYNAPGQDAIPNEILNWLGIPTGTSGGVLEGKIINVVGEGGLNVTSGLGSIPGPKQMIFIEAEGWSISNPVLINNHSVVKQSDSLAVYSLFAKLDPSLNTNGLGIIANLLKSSSASMPDSLERALDELRAVFFGADALTTSKTPTDNRDQFYTNLSTLQSNAGYKALAGKVTIIPSDTSLSTTARTDFASLLSLLTLSPFMLKAVAGNEGAVEAALSNAWAAEYADWQADKALTSAQLAQGQGNYTEHYLADRAQFLAGVIQANTADTGDGKALRADTGGDPIYFEDKTSGLTLQLINSGSGQGTDGPIYRFGGTADDTLFGTDGTEHLYGGAGMDRLDGGKGDDHLEGNAGSDILTGGEGRDTLLGGLGDDILDGGKGSDTLNGGQGFDTYTVGGGNGWDWLDDKDGIGKLLYADSQGGADIQLTGGTAVTGTDNVWKQESNGKTFWFILTDWTAENGETFKRLSIEGPDGGVFVKAWAPGQLGIVLPGAPQENPAPAVLAGTSGNEKLIAQNNEAVLAGKGGIDLVQAGSSTSTNLYADSVVTLAQYITDTANLIGGGSLVAGQQQSGSALVGSSAGDKLVGGASNDVLNGGAGQDQLVGGGGADLLLGDGNFRPVLAEDGSFSGWTLSNTNSLFAIVASTGSTELAVDDGQASADIIHGGGGNDMAWGGQGDDLIFGEAGDDWLVGASGSDVLDGGDGNDLLAGDADNYVGPAGNDVLNGGAGNDAIYGYLGNDQLVGGDGNDYMVGDVPIVQGAPANDGRDDGRDMLDGGAGDDKLWGGGNDDELVGGSGNDELYGDSEMIDPAYHGKDVLDGGDGNDILMGGGADDRLFGGAGDDQLHGDGALLANQGNDVLDGGAGNDYLRGYAGDDALLGGAGLDEMLGEEGNDYLAGGDDKDRLFGGDGNDVLAGDGGDDELSGGNGNDTLQGGGGADIMEGGAGNDTYVDLGMGDVVRDREGVNVFRLNTNSASVRLDASKTGIEIVLPDGIVHLVDALFGTEGNVVFADGTTRNLRTWVNESITTPVNLSVGDGGGVAYGLGGSDFLFGGAGADTLSGGRGNDVLQGGTGDDVFEYALGDGQDTIIETGGSNDVLRFKDGVTPEIIKLTRWWSSSPYEDSLRLEIAAPEGGYVHLKNYFLDNSDTRRVDRIEFANGNVWTYADIQARLLSAGALEDTLKGYAGDDVIDGLAGNDLINGKAGNDTLVGGAGNDNLQGGFGNDSLDGGAGSDSLYGYGTWLDDAPGTLNEAGNDTLLGGAGDDRLYGGQGDDTYLFGRGDGSDHLYEAANSNGTSQDVLRLGAGVLPQHVALYRTTDWLGSDDLTVVIEGSADQIVLHDYFAATDLQVERIEFDNGQGAVWLAADIAGQVQVGTQNAMTGTSGNDIFIVDHEQDSIIEQLNGGTDTVQSSRSYILPINVENLTLIGVLNSMAVGNTLNNTLIGNANDNVLDGKDGNDIAYGGKGNDVYRNVEQIVEASGEGVDTWYSFWGGTLPDNVENLDMSGGSSYRYVGARATGNALDNVLTTGSNGDVLDGGAGADTLVVNHDQVTVYIDNPGDQIVGRRADWVYSSIDYVLGAVADKLTLTGALAISGVGNDAANRLDGSLNSAANVLTGGKGDDVYYLGDGDTAIEQAGEGTDTVVISATTPISFVMDGTSIERVSLSVNTKGTVYGTSGDDGITASGMATLFGGGGNDSLTGGSLSTLTGGSGDDTYHAVGTNVTVIENADEGYDIVQFYNNPNYSSGTFNRLADNVEEGRCWGASVNILGNASDNRLVGDGSSNQLDGGAGSDMLVGGAGDDTYYVDLATDQIVEQAGEGQDWVASHADYVLPDNVEDLYLIDAGILAQQGTGNAANNNLTGNSADNVLSGLGGDDRLDGREGNDLLLGGAGSDRYVFGFGSGHDVIDDVDGASNGLDVLQMNVSASQVTVTRTVAGDIELTLNASDSITVRWDPVAGVGIETVEFDGGATTWDAATLLTNASSHAPTVAAPVADQIANEAEAFTYALPAGIFADLDSPFGDTLELSASLASGQPLPAWLNFDASRQEFSGIPPSGTGLLALRVTATDQTGLSVFDDFTLDVFHVVHGTALGDVLTGSVGRDLLIGYAGDDTLDGGAGGDRLQGGMGNDIYWVDSQDDLVIENPGEGLDTVRSGVSYLLGSDIENLVLTGTAANEGWGNATNNQITGNAAANRLSGGDGDDTLDGGGGSDTLLGGMGNDTFIVDNTSDIVTEVLSEGIDLIQSSVTYTLSANVENLTLTGTSAINGTGNSLDNTLRGNSATNALAGGAGNDTYYVSTGDSVSEATNAGTDTVITDVSWTLGSNLENLTLTGTAAINGTGNTLANTLTGNSAANTLSGGTGADTMIGGAGNDIYVVDNTADVVTEGLSEGTDLIQAGVTYTLSANVENLTLTGTTAINGTGNALDNILIGNSANNTLTGGDGNDTLNGGTGNDTMVGGLGNDLYVVNVSTDVVTEADGAGNDTVQSSVTLTLAANVENLTLTGTTAINGTGNSLDNVLIGNSANNTLTGGDGNDTLDGGTGNDTMVGGLGDDVYVVNISTDIVTEAASAGNDTIQSAVTLTLTSNVETLILTGTTAINGTGNTLANLVRGNSAINTLNGGTGHDILEGGDGNDILTDTSGTALFNGGIGADTITGGTGAEIFLGGLGNDTYTTAAGNDIILFNKGDGQDTFATGGTGSDTISLGGGITYADLVFTKATNDLVLKVGATDQITFKNWYAATPSKPVANLQVIAEAMADFAAGGSDPLRDQKVEKFNFAGLAGAFDAARVANSGLTSWALTNALTSFQLAGSDTAALGGDLAYQYGKNGSLAGIGVTPALATLSDANLGTTAQPLNPLAGLQTGSVRLS